jgi:ubiquinone/menaquinone biosynthesis methyltransferase
MFDRIAGRYDLMNSVMTAGLHHRWRTRTVDRVGVGPGDRALDVCCGTGDLSLELKRRVGPAGEVIGVDFSEPMLELARAKSAAGGLEVDYRPANALSLPFEDAEFDAATVGFGVRNVVDLPRALAELRRVVRPGGAVAILEITTPERPPLSWFYSVWFDRVVPLLGKAGGESDAYSYLPESVRRFPPARELAALMDAAGLNDVRYTLVAGGIVAIHRGTSPPTALAGGGASAAASANGSASGDRDAPFGQLLELDAGRMRLLMDRAERLLEDAPAGHGPQLGEAASETLAAGGKRLRPLLVFICGGTGDGEEIARAAAAVELVHMATLVHDDVLDAAPLRRGAATVFASRGRETALGTGDLLFSRAFHLLARNGSAEQVQALSAACVALARGELAQRHDAWDVSIGIERYLTRCELKTASLFAAACRLGALSAGRGGQAVAALEAYGTRVGVAFQLLDDVLDVSGPPERTGKERGTDLLDGTVTLPLILARERDAALAALDLRDLGGRTAAEKVCDRIAATGALDETRARATELVAEAKALLAGAVDPTLHERLDDVADRIVTRYS